MHRVLSRWLAAVWIAAWLLFFPNAPYILTDIMHLRYDDGVPVLFDVAMLFAFALCGLTLGFVSLRWMQIAAAKKLGLWFGRVFALIVLGMAGFGIYLGRYLRWNSWDIVLNPERLVGDIAIRMAHPLQHWHTWSMSLLFALLLGFVYWLFVIMPQMDISDRREIVR